MNHLNLVLASAVFCASTAYAVDAPTMPTTPQPTAAIHQAVMAQPSEPLTPQAQVTTIVQEAVKYAKEHGDQVAIAEFNRPESQFKKPDMYIFAMDFKGNVLVHGGDMDKVGKNEYDIKDSKGRSVVRALIEKARYGDGAWVSYFWKNPATQTEECKSSFVTTVDKKFVIGAGYHHPLNAKGNCEVE